MGPDDALELENVIGDLPGAGLRFSGAHVETCPDAPILHGKRESALVHHFAREVLTKRAPGRIREKNSAPMRPRVSSVSARCTLTTSATAANSMGRRQCPHPVVLSGIRAKAPKRRPAYRRRGPHHHFLPDVTESHDSKSPPEEAVGLAVFFLFQTPRLRSATPLGYGGRERG